MLKSILIVALVCYGGLLALLYLTQRAMQYFPERFRTAPAEAGLPEAQEIELETPDGERVIAWHLPPRGDKPVILYFHGNGGSLRGRADRFRALTADGTGLVALSYRGYGGSSGRPTEAGLISDATAAYAFARARYPAERIVLWGESLGTGVAVALAAEKPVARVILEIPLQLGRRYCRPPILVRPGALADEGPVPLGFAHRQGHGAGIGAARRARHRGADRSGRAALRADQCAQTLRPVSGRRAQRSRRQWGPRGREAVSRGDITVKAAS